MDLAPSPDPCLSWGGARNPDPSPLGHTHSLASKEIGRKRQNADGFVRAENWLLLLRAGAQALTRKGFLCAPLLNPKRYTLGPMSLRHILCAMPSITYAMVSVPHTRSCVPHTLSCASTLMHAPCTVTHVTYSLDHGPCTMSHRCTMHSVLHVIF